MAWFRRCSFLLLGFCHPVWGQSKVVPTRVDSPSVISIAHAEDVTSLYQNALKHSLPDKKLTNLYKEIEVVFVRGMFGNPGSEIGLVQYFEDHQQWALRTGFVTSTAPVDTQALVATNADTLYQYFMSRARRIVVVAHSKGGLDTLEALIRYPALRQKVVGFISMQSPFLGTEAVERVKDSWWEHYPMRFYFDLVGGGFEAFEEVSPRSRLEHYIKHRQDIIDIAEKVRWISVATVQQGEVSWMLQRQKEGLDLLNLPSDGLVPLRSQYYPDVPLRFVYLTGIDHMDLIGENSSCCRKNFSRVDFLRGLLQILL